MNVTLKEKQLYCILPTSAVEAVPIQPCKLLGITMLAPFCGLGLCKTQTRSLFDTPVGSPQKLRKYIKSSNKEVPKLHFSFN
jgi:hypothetical protein